MNKMKEEVIFYGKEDEVEDEDDDNGDEVSKLRCEDGFNLIRQLFTVVALLVVSEGCETQGRHIGGLQMD